MRERIQSIFNKFRRREAMSVNIPNLSGDDEEEELGSPLVPPNKGLSPRFESGGLLKIVFISLVSAFVVMAIASFLGGGFFVTKKDFTDNMVNVAITLDQAKTELASAKAEVTSAVQGIPGTVATYVNNAVAQSTSQWSSQISAVSDKVSSLEGNTTSLGQTVGSAQDKITELEASITNLQSQLVSYEARIVALESGGSTSSGNVLSISTSGDEAFYTTLETKTGTATFTNGSTTVTGSGTNWNATMIGGKIQKSGDTTWYEIGAVPSATSLTLKAVYGGTPSTGVFTSEYNIARVSMRLTLDNIAGQDVEAIVAEVPVYLDYYGATLTNIYMSGQSGIGNWYIKNPQWRSFILRNANRIDIDAGDRERIYFDFILTFDSAVTSGDVTVDEKDVELVDYDIAGSSSGGSSVTVVSNANQYNITNGATTYVPLTVVNNSNSTVTVPVKLVLTTATPGIYVSTAGMSGVSSSAINGATVTFYTTATVGANSSLTFSQIYIVLNYTGTSPNTWTAIWSKQ